MLNRVVTCLVCLLWGFAAGAPVVQAEESAAWKTLAPGISYREYFLPDPNRVYVVRLDRGNPQTVIDTSLSNGALTAGLEPLSGQVERYNQAITYWDGDWGARVEVVAAINGGFFDTETGVPLNGLIQSGWMVKRFEDRQTSGGFIWRYDRQAFLSECIVQPPGKQRVRLLDTNQSIVLNGINTERGADQLILFTPQFGAQTPQPEKNQNGLEILVELERPLNTYGDGAPVRGKVSAVQEKLGEMFIPFDHVVLSASGHAADMMRDKFPPGTPIAVEFEIRHLNQGCRRERDDGLVDISAGLGGGNIFLREGVIQPLDDLGSVLRNPRSAVALNDSYVFFIVVDGRDHLRSQGMSMVELALFARQRLSAAWGIALDGGGSSTLVVEGAVVNHPNSETVVRAPPEKTPRAVADGLMMGLLQPAEFSSSFQPGDLVSISPQGDANLRLGPGTNFAPLALLPAGSPGVILDHALNGVLAKGNTWWKASFGNQSGWISESVLAP